MSSLQKSELGYRFVSHTRRQSKSDRMELDAYIKHRLADRELGETELTETRNKTRIFQSSFSSLFT